MQKLFAQWGILKRISKGVMLGQCKSKLNLPNNFWSIPLYPTQISNFTKIHLEFSEIKHEDWWIYVQLNSQQTFILCTLCREHKKNPESYIRVLIIYILS
jgi:hypothetical protein